MRTVAFVALSVALLAGCSDTSPSTLDPASSSAQPSSSSVAPSPISPPAVDPVRANGHYQRAQKALHKNQIHSPKGDNAIEHYLLARNSFPAPQEPIESALSELEPYLVIDVEKTIAMGQLAEAERLLNMLKVLDPSAPSLNRLDAELASARLRPLGPPVLASSLPSDPPAE